LFKISHKSFQYFITAPLVNCYAFAGKVWPAERYLISPALCNDINNTVSLISLPG